MYVRSSTIRVPGNVRSSTIRVPVMGFACSSCFLLLYFKFEIAWLCFWSYSYVSFPARASEQGNVIGLVSVYIYIYVIKKKL